MTMLRHLTWMLTALTGLLLSTSANYAQSRDSGDQPGLIAGDSYQLDPEWQKQIVLYRITEAPGTIMISTAERQVQLIQQDGKCVHRPHLAAPRAASKSAEPRRSGDPT